MTQKDTPKLWRDMTDAEKGALLLAHHEGKEIEYTDLPANLKWYKCSNPLWLDTVAYRIKPEPKKPREFWVFTNGHGDLCVSAIWRLDGIHVREVMGDKE